MLEVALEQARAAPHPGEPQPAVDEEAGHGVLEDLVRGQDDLHQAALDRHYAGGPPPGWEEHYVSNYATTHPWEDWAETFAHYLHIRGTLQTAAAYGVYIEGPAALRNSPTSNRFRSDPAHAVANASFDVLMKDWVPLTYALNEINRAMGKDRLYPFVLRPNVVEKLSLVHDLCVAAALATRAAEAATLQGSV